MEYQNKIDKLLNSSLSRNEKEVGIDLVHSIYNPIYFIKNHCKIESSAHGIVPFKLYEYQEDAIKTIEANRFTFFLKSRQMGFTTKAAAYALWYSLKEGNNILLLSRREDDSMDILRKVKIMYEELPDTHKIPLLSSNQTTMEFQNKNRITSLPATERSGAGRTASVIFLDEFSAFPAAKGVVAGEDVWTSILPTVSTNPNSKVIVMSTPKGMGNHFANLWHQENGFAKKFYHWTQHPQFKKGLRARSNPSDGYGKWTSDWAEPLMKNMTPSGWAQEFNGDFVQSGRPVFDHVYLVKNDVFDEDLKFNYHYVCGVDLASGSGEDWHVAQFVCVETGKQVHTLRTKDTLEAFGRKVVNLCNRYNKAKLGFENNSGYGQAFIAYVSDYENLYYQTKFDRKTQKRTRNLGWNTNTKSKELMISDMAIALINGELVLTDEMTVAECKTYQYEETQGASGHERMNAMAGHHDDCVTSLAIAWQVAKTIGDVGEFASQVKKGLATIHDTVLPDGTVKVGLHLFETSPKKDWRYS